MLTVSMSQCRVWLSVSMSQCRVWLAVSMSQCRVWLVVSMSQCRVCEQTHGWVVRLCSGGNLTVKLSISDVSVKVSIVY